MSSTLEDLRLYCRIVELGSLRAAGEEARLDPSNISRRLQLIETRVGARLITRSRLRSTATEAGERYYRELKILLERLAVLEGELGGERNVPRGLLRIAAPSVFGARHVGPWLSELRSPELAIDLLLADRAVDLVERNVDIALRIGELPSSSMIAVRLGTMLTVIVGAPSYLAKNGTPKTPRELEQHEFVLHGGPLQGSALELFGKKDQHVLVKCKSGFTVSSILGVSEAVLAGAGLNAGPLWLYADKIASGELVRVLPAWSPPNYPLHALMLAGAHRPAKITAALDLLRAKVPRLTGIIRS